MKTALIVIDMQVGARELYPQLALDDLIGRINALAVMVRASGGIVVYVQHEGPEGDVFQPDAPGWELLPGLDLQEEDKFVSKKNSDAFLDTSLEAEMWPHNIQRLIITGWATDYCVDTTVRTALAKSYPTIVPSDGHIAADRPHLSAAKIIEHHNVIWADLIAPLGPATAIPCAGIRI